MKKYLLGLLAVSIMSPLLSIVSASVPDNYVLIKEGSNYIDRVDMSSYNLSDYSNFIFVQNYNSVNNFGEPLPDSEKIRCAVGVQGVDGFAYSSNYPGSDYYDQIPFSFEYSFGSLSEFIENNGDTNMFFYCSIDAVEDEDMISMPHVVRTYSLYGLPVGSSSSDSILPDLTVPSSFTSGITQLVENFGGSIVNWLPIVILVTLGITAIFALFRVVRGYAKRSFKG